MRIMRRFKRGLGIWRDLIADNDPTSFAFTLFLGGFSGTILVLLALSSLPGSTLTALGVETLIVLSSTSLAFLVAITLRIIIEWFAYARYK